MDIVIPIGSGSHWGDNELRYSLRSLEMYCKEIERVYLIGKKPEWVKNVKHVFASDTPGREHKERNICNKILLACHLPQLSEDFIFMNDDHFLLAPTPPLPYYYQDKLEVTIKNRSSHDGYYTSLINTYNLLDNVGMPTYNYDIHTPIIYNKSRFKTIMSCVDWSVPYGYVIKSLYANSANVEPVYAADLKITSRPTCFQLEKMVEGKHVFSIGDNAISSELTTFLNYLYPKKSNFEL